MIKWFKKLFHIVKHFDEYTTAMEQLSQQQSKLWLEQGGMMREVRGAVETIKARTEVHGDIHMHPSGDMNQIIMIGKYYKSDYVEIFNVPPDDFELLVHKLKDLRKYARMGKVDAAPGLKQVIKYESGDWRY